ncbi:release factor glutamine methyltransferase [Virgibacillus halotolerans]|uniref:peptide chain release factor N(5)-glutamine methyltransferase n=1 Tax=Virgibacillus halotolerans TaxID=1071053 RepID=UPI00195FF64F|nr:peptide chain release factor N(5)-glutamine methyltransferase [Virgibacillus halotolerans]MBM7598205.1 release factor glutamine methyltransferase [Virgibacillus halotolerans]
MEQLKQYEVLQWASLLLEKHYRESRVAEILLQHYLNVSRSKFYMMMRDPTPEDIVALFKEAVTKHAISGIPVQHITGVEEFYGREFKVNEDVLIPRPETEELVHHIIEAVGDQALTIVDAGTGSGIIAITLSLELLNAKVYATDISTDAIKVATDNNDNLQSNVTFLEGDFLQPLIDDDIKVDVIISNPPYIDQREADSMSDTVKSFDPKIALFAEDDGLAAYKRIIEQGRHIMKDNSMMAFEIGHKQSKSVTSLIKSTYPNSNTYTIKDINGKDRIISVEIGGE